MAAHRLREPIYGWTGEPSTMPWDSDGQWTAWAFVFKNFVASGFFTYDELYAEVPKYVRENGVEPNGGPVYDFEVLRKFRAYLRRVVREKMKTQSNIVAHIPGYGGKGKGVGTMVNAILATEDAERRAEKAK